MKTVTATPLELTRTVRDISVTERNQFRTCRRRWALEVIDNLEPKTPTMALEFGTGMHAMLEHYYLAQILDDEGDYETSIDDAKMALDTWHLEHEADVKKRLGSMATGEVLDELWEARNLGHAMFEQYLLFDAWDKESWTVRAVEGRGIDTFNPTPPDGYGKRSAVLLHESGRFLTPIVHPDTKRCLPGTPYLSGRIDMLVERDSPKKGLWIVDHKTTASSPSDRGLDFEDQVTGYCYIVWRLTGVMPRGVIFNYLVKQSVKEPRTNKTRSHKDPESFLSTAKDQLTTADMYREALEADGLIRNGRIISDKHAECLDALLARGWDPFFKRLEVSRNETEILNFEARLYEEYRDMRAAYNDERKRYPNPSTWWCPGCSVAPVCQAMEDGSDVEGIIEVSYVEGEDRKA